MSDKATPSNGCIDCAYFTQFMAEPTACPECEADYQEWLDEASKLLQQESKMDRKEFFKWLNACPTHKFEVVYDDYNGVYVNFTIADEPTPYVPDRFGVVVSHG